MSEHTESLRWKLWICPDCGKNVGPASPYGEGLPAGHIHRDMFDFRAAEEVEVVPAEQLVKVEAERDEALAEVGVTNPVPVVAVADSSPAASGAHLSPKEAFAECLRVAENKHQQLAALHLADAHRADFEGFKERLTSGDAVHRAWAEVLDEIPPEDVLPEPRGEERVREILRIVISAAEPEPNRSQPMPPEPKGIERFRCGVKKRHGYLQPYMAPAAQGGWVKYDDHLAVLGEATATSNAALVEAQAIRDTEQDRAEAAEQQLNLARDDFDREKVGRMAAEERLQGLREGLGAEVERLRKKAADDSAWADERYEDGALSTATRVWARSQTTAALSGHFQALLDTYSVDEGSGA
jgi:hypothetical protein